MPKNRLRPYPGLARTHPEFKALLRLSPLEANKLRTEAILGSPASGPGAFDKLPDAERAELKGMATDFSLQIKRMGWRSALELLAAVSVVMDDLDWPRRGS